MAWTVDELRDEIASHLQDPASQLVNRQQLLQFINSAAWDAANEGWVIALEEDESLTLAAGTYDYTIPSGFAYLHEVYVANAGGTYGEAELVPLNRWRLVYNSSAAKLRFSEEFFTITDTRSVKLVGQARPTSEYSEDTDNIDAGMESFIRERATMYAARNLSRHGGQHAQQYAQLEQEALQTSELMLRQQPERFQPKEYARPVPLR
jgi:hypothetical protein